MTTKSFPMKKEFFNYLYNAVNDKLHESIENSALTPHSESGDERVSEFWGDFFEQVFQIDRKALLEKSYGRLSNLIKPGYDINEPSLNQILYYAELANICGTEELDFDEIYLPHNPIS